MECGGGAAAFFAAALALLSGVSLSAATVSGTVRDDDGSRLPGIRVHLLEVSLAQCCADQLTTTAANGTFAFDAPPSVYVVRADAPTPYYPALARVDLRSASSSTLQLTLTRTPRRYIPDQPPRADKITVSAPDTSHQTTVRGEAGAVFPNGVVVLHTLDMGALKLVEAAADGSFTATTFAPAGASILIKHDPWGDTARVAAGQLFARKPGDPPGGPTPPPPPSDERIFLGVGGMAAMPGTIMGVPLPVPPPDGRVLFGSAGNAGTSDTYPPHWVVQGSINRTQFAPGAALEVQATMTIDSPVLATHAAAIGGTAVLVLERVSFEDGRPASARPMEASALLTPTGFALESPQEGDDGRSSRARPLALARTSATHAEGQVQISLPIASDLPAGYYRPTLRFFFGETFPPRDPTPSLSTTTIETHHDRLNALSLPVIRVGDPAPPRLFATLFSDGAFSGTRGAVAIEDASCCNLASIIQSPSKTLVVPRIDERSGAVLRYRLEPHVILVSHGDRGIAPNPPLVRFRFPSGSLTARVEHADGTVETIGPAPFVQARVSGPLDRHGRPPDPGGRSLHDTYQLSTMDPRFEIAFRSEGPHRIQLDGAIEDVWGTTWRVRGTYVVQVGRTLTLDMATLPGTPFEVGDALTPAVTVRPPLPADVDVRVQLDHQTTRVLDETRRTRANRFGSATASAVTMPRPGEYRVDVEASHRDAEGRWWFGSRSWGGVVATPGTPIVARGIRGIDGVPTETQPIWFFRDQTPAQPIPHSHVNLPFEPGDVAWLQEGDALVPIVVAQDTEGSILQLLTSRMGGNAAYAARAAVGEMELFSSTPEGLNIYTEPDKVDVWAYAYRSIQRPAVRVREQIAILDRGLPSMYWRFSEFYGNQTGVGRNGDRPNDFKFQFGGTVIRGSRLAQPHYSIYGSLFVLVPFADPGGGTRVFPPFQGNGGGPSGGPLFTLDGEEIDLFFHPTGVRSGTILSTGEIVSFAGYSAPPLPSRIEIVVTSPNGRQRTISGRANRVGWFHEPSADFVASEAGLWRARVTIVFDGRTSFGQVTAPFPTGGILGARELTFYVVDSGEPPLAVAVPQRFVRPADAPVRFALTPPVALTNAELSYTATMPGFVLDEGRRTSLTYDYDARALAARFPNLDLEDAEGAAGADSITLSFVVTGNDEAGARRHFARQIVIEGEEVQVTAQARTTRRRAVR